MGDVIERHLEVEQRARSIIADAEREAIEIVERARDEARTTVTQGREKARRQADELTASGTRALQDERERLVAEAKSKLPSPESMPDDVLAKAARYAVNVIAYGAEPEE